MCNFHPPNVQFSSAVDTIAFGAARNGFDCMSTFFKDERVSKK